MHKKISKIIFKKFIQRLIKFNSKEIIILAIKNKKMPFLIRRKHFKIIIKSMMKKIKKNKYNKNQMNNFKINNLIRFNQIKIYRNKVQNNKLTKI